MAEQVKKMAKSTMEGVQPCWSYLFHDRGHVLRPYSFTAHTHPFWQIDFITRGRFRMQTIAGVSDLCAGDCLITPAGVEHGFDYPEPESCWLSVKCAVEGYAAQHMPRVIPMSPIRAGIEQAIQVILATQTAPPREYAELLPNLFLALLAYAFPIDDPAHPVRSVPVQSMINYASGNRYQAPAVRDVAQAAGYSANHASSLFRQEMGCTLKHYLDQQRAEEAARLLRYSEASITEIAHRLRFSDVYAFSRFFRRVYGVSPRGYRTMASEGERRPTPK